MNGEGTVEEAAAMEEKREINAKGILADIRVGLSDEDIMKKYKLSTVGLRSVFRKLIKAGAITDDQITVRFEKDEKSNGPKARKSIRYDLTFHLPVYDQAKPYIKGRVLDITEKGIGVEGIEAKPEDTLILVVGPADASELPEFAIEAICRWHNQIGSRQEHKAGFEITAISEKSLDGLRQLINLVATPD